MKVAVTGHRPDEFVDEQTYMVRTWLNEMAVYLRDHRGMTAGISGMAMGADIWWAQAVEKAGVRLEAHIPYWGQASKWPSEWRSEWERLVLVSKEVVVYGRTFPYDVTNFFKRNEGMCVECDLMLAVWAGKKKGGTYHCFEKFKKTGKPWLQYDFIENKVLGSVDETERLR